VHAFVYMYICVHLQMCKYICIHILYVYISYDTLNEILENLKKKTCLLIYDSVNLSEETLIKAFQLLDSG